MNNLKIGIVEDNLLITESLHDTLTQIGYTPTPPARSYDEAIAMIQQHSPDLLLIDIIIEGQQDGIDLAETIKKEYNLPFIFLTANSDPQTVNRAKQVAPYAYLVKPFNEADLFSAIEIAFGKFCNEQTNDLTNAKTKNYLKNMLFVKYGELFHKLAIEEIVYIKSDNVYLNIYTEHKKYIVRTKLEDFIVQQCGGHFLRTHRSYAINPRYIDSITNLHIKVSHYQVPMHKTYRQQILSLITIIK